MNYFMIYLILVNIIGAGVVLLDKKAAREHRWRIRESTLFLFSAFGGSIGVYAAMRAFHHKTRHKRFMWGIPAIFLAEIVAGICIYLKIKGAFL